ncbi:hypothetical protein AB5N19_09656 [Seiridium cardinale]
MAMPYPEGEVFFKRSTLALQKGSNAKAWGFDPDKLEDFASHILIEFIYNNSLKINNHYRSYGKSEKIGSQWIDFPDSHSVMFAEENDPGKTIRHVEIDSCANRVEFRDSQAGGPDKVCIVPIPVKPKERFMFIDLLVPVRAIYFPLAQKVDNIDPDLCTYLMVDFRFRKGVKMLYPPTRNNMSSNPKNQFANGFGGMMGFGSDLATGKPGEAVKKVEEKVTHYNHRDFKFSYKRGLDLQYSNTLSLDIRGIYNLLILPRQLRGSDKGLYCPTVEADTLIKMYNYHDVPSNGIYHATERRSLEPFLDYTKVIQDHFGVDVTWQPYEFKEEPKDLVTEIFILAVKTGLDLIPYVGPLASAGFSVLIEVLEDPEAFKANNILKLDGDTADAVAATAVEVAKNLPKISGKGGKAGAVSKGFKMLSAAAR